MKKILTTLALLATITAANAQFLPTIAVIGIDSRNNSFTAETVTSLVRLELEKTAAYSVPDQYDVEGALKKDSLANHEDGSCFSKECLVQAGKILKAQKIISGAVQVYGDKVAITLKLMDVYSGNIEKMDVKEYINTANQLQNMIHISVRSLLGLSVESELMNTLLYYESTAPAPTTTLHNSGPRMGVAYVSGHIGQRMSDPASKGGYGGYPVLTSFGYQWEAAYLSAGNFRALFETMFVVEGLEQSLFMPSALVMNGFRDNKHGWEVGFGPTFSIRQIGVGFWDQNDKWVPAAQYIPDSTSDFVPEFTGAFTRGGDLHLFTGWVWAVGKTFRSGYLNIPVNAFVVPKKEGWYAGLSVGFNIRKKGS